MSAAPQQAAGALEEAISHPAPEQPQLSLDDTLDTMPTVDPDWNKAVARLSALVPQENIRPIQMSHPTSPFAREPWRRSGRGAMGIGGAVLITLFFFHWHSVTSWQLLQTVAGIDFVRQLFYLVGGVVLLVTALLPVPFAFRAGVGAILAVLPVIFAARVLLDGWRGIVAALALVGLPATHLLRAHAQRSRAARLLVLGAVVAIVLLYVVPSWSVVPIVGVFNLIGSGQIGLTIMGVFILLPLVFAALSLFGALGRDLTDIGVLLSTLILLWAPVVMALRGLLIDDISELYVAVGLLAASACAAVSWAQLLSIAAHTETP